MELWPRIKNHSIYEKEILSTELRLANKTVMVLQIFSNRKIENKKSIASVQFNPA